MTIKELEKIITDMRISYVKEHYKDCFNLDLDFDGLTKTDIIGIYVTMQIKEEMKER